MNDFAGKHVLITGAAKRVGAHLARTFAEAGARVIVHYSTSGEEALALVKELGGSAAGHSAVHADLTVPAAVTAFVDSLPQDISILINNASVFRRNPFLTEPLADGKEQFDVNFWSPVELMRQICRHSTEKELSIVNIADCAIGQNSADSFSYLLSKKALAEASRCAALQLAPRVRVNAVAPGPMLAPPGLEHLHMEKTLKQLPLKRPVALDDIAEAVLFLAGNRSVTGTTLFVDCGMSL